MISIYIPLNNLMLPESPVIGLEVRKLPAIYCSLLFVLLFVPRFSTLGGCPMSDATLALLYLLVYPCFGRSHVFLLV